MSDELELEIPISAGAKSTEENVLAIYIYCPELLYEDPIDPNLFSYPSHKKVFEAIMCGLEDHSSQFYLILKFTYNFVICFIYRLFCAF